MADKTKTEFVVYGRAYPKARGLAIPIGRYKTLSEAKSVADNEGDCIIREEASRIVYRTQDREEP